MDTYMFIQVGDIVNVHFDKNSLNELTVMKVPQATGDHWSLMSKNGEVYNIQLYEYMERIKTKEKSWDK